MLECYVCFQELTTSINWGNFFTPGSQQYLCDVCRDKLDQLDGSRCRYCSRRSTDMICYDCKRWHQSGAGHLEFNYSVFAYNDFMKEVVARWKYRGDYQIAKAFAADFRQAFHSQFAFLKNPIFIPVPLSEERLQERAFNQAKQLASFLPGEILELLKRKNSEKQSKKSREERMISKNPFLSKGPINKPVIVVDDIYTTGTTLHHAAAILKARGCPAVYGFTLIRG